MIVVGRNDRVRLGIRYLNARLAFSAIVAPHFLLPLLLLLGYTPPLLAQDPVLHGQLRAQRTHAPIPFVSIGVTGKNVGTVADAQGAFSLRVPPQVAADSLTFSAIGYQPQTVAITQLVATQQHDFLLVEKPTVLPAVVVRARVPKTRRLGTTTHNPFLWGSAQQKQTQDIVEFAKLIPVAHTPSELVQAHIFLRRPTVDTVTFRLNFYRAGADRPAERLVERTILVRTAIHNGWLTIDLAPYALTVQTDFYLSFEFLPDKHLPVPAFSYGAQLGGAALVRTSSLGTWKREPGASLTAYVTVRQ